MSFFLVDSLAFFDGEDEISLDSEDQQISKLNEFFLVADKI